MTTAKAMMINTAFQYDWTSGGPNGDLTRNRQGWGMPDVGEMYDRRNDFFIVNEDDVLQNGESTTYQVVVGSGADQAPMFKATLTYADPPGVPFSSEHRVNDVSLKLTSPSGTVYWGNNGLLDDIVSTPGGSADTINTVENVFIQGAENGIWTIEVIASEVNQDGHVETPEFDVDYALVVSPISSVVTCDGDVDGDGDVGMSDLLLLLANWGPCKGSCGGLDLDGSGEVDFADVLLLLAAWGPCE